MTDLATATILAALTVLIGAVIGSAIVPTIIAQRWFAPPVHVLTTEEIIEVEDEEFEPPRPHTGKMRRLRTPASTSAE